ATAKKAFEGKSQASLIASILTSEPAPVSTIQPMTPPALDRVVRTCLAKDPEDRWQSAGDIAKELKWIAEGSAAGVAAPVLARRRSRERVAWILAILFGIGLAVTLPLSVLWRPRGASEGHNLKLSILPPEKAAFQPGMIAISPDGIRLAFSAATAEGKNFLWIRPLDALEAKPLPGTDGAYSPFWSPDGRFIAFFAGGKLKKIEVSGGPPQSLCDVLSGRGGTWSREGVIVFTPAPGERLFRVSAAGGPATPVTTLDSSRQENSHRWPVFLPDGRHFLYFARSRQKENRAIYVGSIDSKETRPLMSGNSNVLFAPSSAGTSEGYLLFEREGFLMARRFDAATLRLEGDPLTVAERVRGSDPLTAANFTVSQTGVLAYGRGTQIGYRQLVWIDRSGKLLGSIGPPGIYVDVNLSPDGKRAALDTVNIEVGGREVALMDLTRGVMSRLTPGETADWSPVWSPDGSRIAFGVNQTATTWDLYQKPSSGAGKEELLLKSDSPKVPEDWSPDGRFLLYTVIQHASKREIWVLPLSGDRKGLPVLQTPFDEFLPNFSPDGRWIVYVSDESGRPEVYVQTFPISSAKWRVSTNGGSHPRWRRDGKEIFYFAPEGRLMAVPVTAGAAFEAGAPRMLFETGMVLSPLNERHRFCVAADGERFLLLRNVEEQNAQPLTVVFNWMADLKR
ncbi:MAG TPA: hypothetical protein VER78_03740, partial [Thermoanaerobaculia bacterium]|nr:hypothetical protein [Thermoanaerobaculia bacterium]